MDEKILKTYNGFDPNIIELVKNALKESGKPVIRLDQVSTKIEYEDKYSNVYKPNIHIGQRKLMLNEIQFLNRFIRFSVVSQTRQHFVIYAGGSPGHHMYELSRYYPNVTFIIIDPSRHQSYVSDSLIVFNNKFCKYVRSIYYDTKSKYIHDLLELESISDLLNTEIRIFIINELCTSNLLLNIKNLITSGLSTAPIFYFWSDIRTDNAEAGKFGRQEGKTREELKQQKALSTVTDGDILWNLAMQYNWIKDLQPEASMLKFRLPFYTNDIDNLKLFMSEEIGKDDFAQCPELRIAETYKDKKLYYPKGKIYIQPWQPKSSTESRLVIKKKNINNLEFYDAIEYDALFNYYNCIERPIRKHNNGTDFYQYGYCECNDCSIELTILKDYLLHNMIFIMKEFKVPKQYNLIEVIGNISIRLAYLLGIKLEIPGIHGINRY